MFEDSCLDFEREASTLTRPSQIAPAPPEFRAQHAFRTRQSRVQLAANAPRVRGVSPGWRSRRWRTRLLSAPGQYMNEIYELSEDQTDVGEKREAPFDEGSEETLRLLKHIQAFADFYRAMFRAKADPYFLQLFRKKTEKLFLSCIAQTYPRLVPEPDAPPSDLKLNVIAYAGFGAIVWWLEQEQSCPPEHLAIWLDQLIGVIASLALKPKG